MTSRDRTSTLINSNLPCQPSLCFHQGCLSFSTFQNCYPFQLGLLTCIASYSLVLTFSLYFIMNLHFFPSVTLSLSPNFLLNFNLFFSLCLMLPPFLFSGVVIQIMTSLGWSYPDHDLFVLQVVSRSWNNLSGSGNDLCR